MITTKTGDDGTTSLGDGSRTRKDDPKVECYGAVDEANSQLGHFLSIYSGSHVDLVKRIQKELFVLGSDISTPLSREQVRISPDHVRGLEEDIRVIENSLPQLKRFILPGGSQPSAILHIARTTIRRAERRLTESFLDGKINDNTYVYLNRLSDFLFVLARKVNVEMGSNEEQVDIGA